MKSEARNLKFKIRNSKSEIRMKSKDEIPDSVRPDFEILSDFGLRISGLFSLFTL